MARKDQMYSDREQKPKNKQVVRKAPMHKDIVRKSNKKSMPVVRRGPVVYKDSERKCMGVAKRLRIRAN